MGTPKFAQVILQDLLLHFEVVGLFCQPDKPFGRKQETKMPITKEFLIQHYPHIPVFQPSTLDENLLGIIKTLRVDIIVVVAYGQILPKSFLAYRCINLHASILPKYRGASPLQEMLLNDEKYWGVSAMLIEEGLDSGDILGFGILPSNQEDMLLDLANKLANLGAKVLKDVLDRLQSIEPLKQDTFQASYCKKIKKQEGLIDFENAREIFLKFRAYSNWPSIFLENGLKIFDIALQEEEGAYKKGEILAIQEDGILIGCKKGKLKIGMLQAPNKQKIQAKAYILGKRLQVGMILQ